MLEGGCLNRSFKICSVAGLLFLCVAGTRGQEARNAPSSIPPASSAAEAPAEITALIGLIHDLQAQVQVLNSQLGDLRAEQARATAESRQLRLELEAMKSQGSGKGGPLNPYAAPAANEASRQPASVATPSQSEPQSPEDRIAKLEEDQQVLEGKINDQYQTKVESGSKYRVRLSGIVLLNLFENRGAVDNIDFPVLAQPAPSPAYTSTDSFGGSLRQSRIRLQVFGPDVADARTSADINFDFAGGFPLAPNGAAFGLVRLRTGTVRFDWTNTSIVGGQDRLFFVPLAPTSLATLAVPALSYAGNLWAWTPQVRIEHRVVLSDASSLSFQGGILDNLTGESTDEQFYRDPSWGEQSGQPAYAARISWSHHLFGQDFTLGVGGFYGRQSWGLGRKVNGWAGTTDLTLPIGKRLELTGEFYRGQAVAGLGGGIGQDVLLDGPFVSPTTTIRGLDSTGGWAQLKIKVKSNFEINGAFGLDNPFADEVREYTTFGLYSGTFTRNQTTLVNFIYQIRSNILFSTEYRYLNTTLLDSGSNSASHINLSMGYLF